MKESKMVSIDNIDEYNKWYGCETQHPLVTVVSQQTASEWINGAPLCYGLYGLFLKQGAGCSARYGCERFDYQKGISVRLS